MSMHRVHLVLAALALALLGSVATSAHAMVKQDPDCKWVGGKIVCEK